MTAEPPDGPDDRTDGDVGGTGTPSLKERQRTWERAYRFRLWDARGGPTKFQRWYYDRPNAAALGVLVGTLFAAAAMTGFATIGLQPAAYGLMGAALARWNLPIIRDLHDEWRATRSPRDEAADQHRRGGSWLQRLDERHQAEADTEREHGSRADQPATRIFGAMLASYLGALVVLALVVELIRSLVT